MPISRCIAKKLLNLKKKYAFIINLEKMYLYLHLGLMFSLNDFSIKGEIIQVKKKRVMWKKK